MRIFALLFFIQTFPLVLFITTLLYGGFSTTVLKVELAKNGLYEQAISVVKESSEEGTTDPILAIIKDHITPEYVQTKAEGVIDDTALWVTGKTETTPVLSFKDIKDEMLATNPHLLTNIQTMVKEAQEVQKAQAAKTGEPVDFSQQKDLETFINNDFSFPLKDSLISLKQTYLGLVIALPVLVVLLILSLVGLWFWNPTLQKRLRWFGIAFLITGVLGIVTILLNQGISTTSLDYLVGQEDQIVQMAYPIVERILVLFVTQHAVYQTIANYVLFGAGIVCLVLSFVLKSPAAASQPSKPTKPTKKSR